ncbi:hypothetical protein T484DRAFT_1747215 [Baffinella frigidus]|nr:hypothetical protein T484DRAFT_1747215 [Cryptophyta sp. CCMP2293]
MELSQIIPDAFYPTFCHEVSSAAAMRDHKMQVSQSSAPPPIDKGGNDNAATSVSAILEQEPHSPKTPVGISLLRNRSENKQRVGLAPWRASPTAVCGEDAATIAELYAEIHSKFHGQPTDDHLLRLSSLRRRSSLPNGDQQVRPSSLRRSSVGELPPSPKERLASAATQC